MDSDSAALWRLSRPPERCYTYSPMLSLRKMRCRCLSIVWLMVVAVLMLTLAPHHYHLHHDTAPGSLSHQHSIDLHLLSDAHDEAHHDEAIAFEATPDGLVKPFGDKPLNILLTVFLLALLPIVDSRTRHPSFRTATSLGHAFYHLTPPLRAPPRQ